MFRLDLGPCKRYHFSLSFDSKSTIVHNRDIVISLFLLHSHEALFVISNPLYCCQSILSTITRPLFYLHRGDDSLQGPPSQTLAPQGFILADTNESMRHLRAKKSADQLTHYFSLSTLDFLDTDLRPSFTAPVRLSFTRKLTNSSTKDPPTAGICSAYKARREYTSKRDDWSQ